jgi:opacity protein-like surface antigen
MSFVKVTRHMLVAAMLVTGGSIVAQAAPAQAAQGCGGTLVGQHVYAGGYAQVDVYFNGSTNCLINRTRGSSWGQAKYMGIAVKRSSSSTFYCNVGDKFSLTYADCGYFNYYAGPVKVYAPHSCISFSATVKKANGTVVHRTWFGVHCG